MWRSWSAALCRRATGAASTKGEAVPGLLGLQTMSPVGVTPCKPSCPPTFPESRFANVPAGFDSFHGDLPMNLSLWRKTSIAILSVAILNMGMAGAASAAIVDTSAMVTTDREADLGTVRSQLERAEVRAQMEKMGLDPQAVDRRIASLNDRE